MTIVSSVHSDSLHAHLSAGHVPRPRPGQRPDGASEPDDGGDSTPDHLAAFPQAVQRAGYEARLRTVRIGSTPFTLARFMRGQRWAVDHRERIRAALDADPRLVRIRGRGHPQWRRITGPSQTRLETAPSEPFSDIGSPEDLPEEA